MQAPTPESSDTSALEVVADLDLEVLGGDVVEKGLRILVVNQRDDPEQLVKRDRDDRRLDGKFDHASS